MDVETVARIKVALFAKAGEFARKVAPAYKAMEWVWSCKGNREVPGQERIKTTLEGLINGLCQDGGSFSTGGLTVWIEDVDGAPAGGLEFGMGLALDRDDWDV